jgi:hypothetical protein
MGRWFAGFSFGFVLFCADFAHDDESLCLAPKASEKCQAKRTFHSAGATLSRRTGRPNYAEAPEPRAAS